MADNPTDEIAKALAKALEAASELASGTLSLIAALVSVLEQRDPKIKHDLIEKIEILLDGMSPEERESPSAVPLHCLLDFLHSPDKDIPRRLH